MTGDFSLLAQDLMGLSLASLGGIALLLLPGALVAKLLAPIVPTTRWRSFSPALSFASVPAIGALVLRYGGIVPLAVLLVALALAALVWARDFMCRPSKWALGAAVAWWLFVAALYCDIDVGGRLYQPLTILDLVKHASVVRELATHGLPLRDPFFARPTAAGYYHDFYDGAAVLDRLGSGLIDARMAFAGCAFACGIAFAALLRALVVELGWQTSSDKRLTQLTILACAVGGFDLIGIAFRWWTIGIVEANSEWWDDEISFFPTSASWVPHHLAGVIASFVALLLLSQALRAETRRTMAMLAGAAGIAMASAFGLSVWVTIGTAAVLALALVAVPNEKRRRWIFAVLIAGVIALMLSAGQLLDLVHGRPNGGAPIWLWIREPARLGGLLGHEVPPVLSLLLTPLIWVLEFGPFAIGAWLFWKRSDFDRASMLACLFAASAFAGLAMNLLLRSTIINNDFGWRVAWFTALPAMVWTIAILQEPLPTRGWKLAMGLAITFGLGATAYNLVGARIIRPPLARTSFAYLNADPEVDYGLAAAYRWANDHIPPGAILQHDPEAAERAFDFGLYGNHPTLVADREAELFGAGRNEVIARADTIHRIFTGELPISSVGEAYLVVTRSDPLWARLPRDWVHIPLADGMRRAGRAPMTNFLRILATYALAGLAGFALYVLSFGLGIGGEILFYRGLVLAAASDLVLALLIALVARRWRIDLATLIGAVLTSMAFNICFLVLIPVTIDRSISVFLLSRIEANQGITEAELERRFAGDYIEGMEQIPRRIHEEQVSGNIVEERDGSIRLTGRGRRFNAFARLAARWFGTDRRFVEPSQAEGSAAKARPSEPAESRVPDRPAH